MDLESFLVFRRPSFIWIQLLNMLFFMSLHLVETGLVQEEWIRSYSHKA